jgi:hypothetical protein
MAITIVILNANTGMLIAANFVDINHECAHLFESS